MAYSAAVNPVVESWPGNSSPPVTTETIVSATWKKGQLAYTNSGAVTAVSTAVTGAGAYQFMEDEAVATTSGLVRRLTSGTRLLMRVRASAVDSAETVATLGTSYGVITASNVTYLDTDTGSGYFKVVAKGSSLEPIGMTAAMTPGVVLVEYTG